MNGQDLKINIIPYSLGTGVYGPVFFKRKRDNAVPLHLSECPLEIAETFDQGKVPEMGRKNLFLL